MRVHTILYEEFCLVSSLGEVSDDDPRVDLLGELLNQREHNSVVVFVGEVVLPAELIEV